MLTHHYGPDVLVFDDPYFATLLASGLNLRQFRRRG